MEELMSDDDGRISPRDHAEPKHYGETLLYDFAKFITTLSLLALGAMLTISQAARAGDVKIPIILFVSAAIGFAGVLSFLTAAGLAEARATGRDPDPRLPKYLKLAIGLLALGIGGFMMMWVDSLS
jgi:hypothetical protein